ncbi:MAG: antitoxin [Gammaproteobacteria bacterium RIFCSPHIGHO2_12_FULL_37_34]|nr:MAG: antitoxin [Gammaproteobacteria bacterium RIFCSPHIGHO2_12_FULL_37_34]
MATYTATKARANLYRLIDQVSHSHKPIHITSKKSNAVLVSEEDWSALQETLYLLSIPNMGTSIRKGLKIPLNKCDENLDW